jgi:tetratricopeptide (TPR) repeat protein
MASETGLRNRPIRLVSLLSGILFLCACSSAPKAGDEVYSLRKQAETQLDEGNKEADRGNYESALIMLNEARRIAVSADDPSLRIRTGLSRGNVLFTLGQAEEAAAAWKNALAEAEQLGNPELTAVSRVHQARGRLLSPGGAASAQAIREEVNGEMAAITDSLYTAFAHMVSGLAEKELGRYAEAEAALSLSVAIHEKERNLEKAAYDWYLIASFRSLAGNYNGARQALETAMTLDRRVENSYGLATDWRALGDILKKAGQAEEARQAYRRSAEIFRALGHDEEASATENR